MKVLVALEMFVVGFLVCCFFGLVFVVVDDESDVASNDDASSKGDLLKAAAVFDAVLVTAGTPDDGFSIDDATAKNVSKRAETPTALLPIL